MSAKKALIVYYSLGEVPKVADKLEKLFLGKSFSVKKFVVETKQKIEPKKQFRVEKELKLKKNLATAKEFDVIAIGTPIISFSSIPAINVFIRSLNDIDKKKVVLFATGIGLPGKTFKRMKSLLSMKGAEVIDAQAFMSIFEFDSKKLLEVDKFFEGFIAKI